MRRGVLLLLLSLPVALAAGVAAGGAPEATRAPVAAGAAAPPAAAGELAAPPGADPAWVAEVAAWRARRDASLRQPDGWLTLVGLEWLEPGDNPLGSGENAAVRFPPRAPERLGTLVLEGSTAWLEPAAGVEIRADGEPVGGRLRLASDASGAPTELTHDGFTFYLVERDGRLAVRLKDAESPVRTGFIGMEYFPLDPAWRVEARFTPNPPGTTVPVPNFMGYLEDTPAPGVVSFERAGETDRLTALEGSGGQLFLVFADATSGVETYGGGRFLYTDPPAEGRVVVDFNRAYNPPCVFTPYATCPLPPEGNELPFAIRAGETAWEGAAH